MSSDRATVTEIVASVFCEQKAMFDAEHGDRRPAEIEALARRGTFEHVRLEWEGYTQRPGLLASKVLHRPQKQGDARCFIASYLYGAESWQTNALRSWRDDVLIFNPFGRAFVWVYYRTSPHLIRALSGQVLLTRCLRALIDRLVLLVAARR